MTNFIHDIISPEIHERLIDLMWDAGDKIMEIYQSDDVKLFLKNDQSPVTQADKAAHELLLKGLLEITPDIPVVSEEATESFNIPKNHQTYWLIDPLDGTKEFINKNGEFTCNLALIKHHRAVYGFVSVPVLGLLYFGGFELGARRRDRNDKEILLQCCQKLGTTRIIASKSHLNLDTQNFIKSIEGDVEIIQAGSSLKFLKIAEGSADIYPRLGPTCEWDTAAAHSILEGAGGIVTQPNGEMLTYGKDNIKNPYFIARSLKTPL